MQYLIFDIISSLQTNRAKKGTELIIFQNENTQNQFANALKEFQIKKLLQKANIRNLVVFPHMKYFHVYCCYSSW